ncbi:hypothetical protein ACLOJK_005418 [Asimina triloba]
MALRIEAETWAASFFTESENECKGIRGGRHCFHRSQPLNSPSQPHQGLPPAPRRNPSSRKSQLLLPPSPLHAWAPSPSGSASPATKASAARALFSGVSAIVLRQTLYSITRMGLYEILKSNWSDVDSGTIPLPRKIAAGLIAGAVGAAVGNPADVAMVRMQADGLLPESQHRNYSNVGDAIRRMWRQEGVASLWRGSSLTVNRAMIVTASQLATYDQVKETMLKKKMMHVPGQSAAANLGERGDSLMCVRADGGRLNACDLGNEKNGQYRKSQPTNSDARAPRARYPFNPIRLMNGDEIMKTGDQCQIPMIY